MATTSCSMCGLPGTDLRSVAGMHKICPQCRWKGEHKCLVKGCTTPNSKVKLKNIPGRLVQATEAVRGKIFSQFGMPSELKQCCKSCFTKLHRATAEFATNLTQATTAHEVQNKGRPTVSYENGSTKTKKRIERKAMDLLNNTISNFKDSCNEMSGGCGEKLLDITFQAANLPRPSVETTDEVKALMQLGMSLTLCYALFTRLQKHVQLFFYICITAIALIDILKITLFYRIFLGFLKFKISIILRRA